jgi:hypothetical protein
MKSFIGVSIPGQSALACAKFSPRDYQFFRRFAAHQSCPGFPL